MEPHRATQKAPGHDLDSSCCLTPRSPLARERPLLKPSLKKPSRCCIVHREAGSNSARGSTHLASCGSGGSSGGSGGGSGGSWAAILLVG